MDTDCAKVVLQFLYTIQTNPTLQNVINTIRVTRNYNVCFLKQQVGAEGRQPCTSPDNTVYVTQKNSPSYSVSLHKPTSSLFVLPFNQLHSSLSLIEGNYYSAE